MIFPFIFVAYIAILLLFHGFTLAAVLAFFIAIFFFLFFYYHTENIENRFWMVTLISILGMSIGVSFAFLRKPFGISANIPKAFTAKVISHSTNSLVVQPKQTSYRIRLFFKKHKTKLYFRGDTLLVKCAYHKKQTARSTFAIFEKLQNIQGICNVD
ncbi:MAG: hypothetical protein D6767_06300, partial [Candidatus Hydrogenedentota bacterium]